MAEKESDIQKSILNHLLWRRYFVWRNHTTGIYNKRGGGFIPTGMTGVADILGILPDGRFLAIEVKRPKGKLTENQTTFLKNIEDNKGLAFVARSIVDVEQVFIKEGLKW